MSPWRVRRRLFVLCRRSWPTLRALLPRRAPTFVDLDDSTRKTLIREAEFQAKTEEYSRARGPLRKGPVIPALTTVVYADPGEYFVPCPTPGCPLGFSHGGVCADARD